MNKYILLLGIILFWGCQDSPPPCQCDMLGKQEEFFIQKAHITKTDSDKKSVSEGDDINLELELDANPELAAKKLSLQLGKVSGKVKVKVPIPNFKDKYFNEYYFDLTNMNEHDKRKQLYFISYCSYYPIFHKPKTCEPLDGWQSKIDKLFEIFLKPVPSSESEKSKPKNSIQFDATNSKVNINIDGTQKVEN